MIARAMPDPDDFDLDAPDLWIEVHRELRKLLPEAVGTLKALMRGGSDVPGQVRLEAAQYILQALGAMDPPPSPDDDDEVFR